MLKKVLTGVLFLSTIAFSEILYTDGTRDIRTCAEKEKIGSIDFPCPIREVIYSRGIEAHINQKAPKTVSFLLEGEEETITAICKNYSYTLVIKAKDKCDNRKVIKDRRIVEAKDIDVSKFNKEYILNQARNLMVGMIKGVPVRGYEIKPINKEVVIDYDDFFRAKFFKIYDGAYFIGFIGKVKNYSKYITKKFDIKKMMGKGYVLGYIENIDNKVFQPQEERTVYFVVLKSYAKLPYMER